MDEKLKKFAQRLIGTWKAFNNKKKIIIVSAVAVVIIVLIMVITAVNTTKYELLCNGLSVSEAGQVYNAVSAKNIPVKVSGTAI
jgi:flagellar M-ring protein FliF